LGILLVGCDPVSNSPVVGEGNLGQEITASPAVSASVSEARVIPGNNKDYLVNPGIGWQDGPEPFGIMNFPETVAYANRRDIAWAELNPAKGAYDWTVLDAQLESAVKTGKQFSFRIYSFVGEGFDGNKVPDWVLNEGARLLPSGEPDYSNCIYQAEWGEFIHELIRVYEGNPDIAFIDISGYGNFNEWSWQDSQTEWDERWEEDYSNGTASAASFSTLDGQARRRLVDIFIGGSFSGHACRNPNGTIAQVDYTYPGFQKTQLIMPYAGIVQSSQYVVSRRSDIGFRHDCLGRDGKHLFEKAGNEILRTWKNAPVVYELCKPAETDVEDARWLLQMTHGSIVHNNKWSYSLDQLEGMMLPVGYRYFLKEIYFKIVGRWVDVEMEWQNLGLAPNYPKMGQDFRLYFCLLDKTGRFAFKDPVPVEISKWLPSGVFEDEPPSYKVSYENQLPSFLEAGKYLVGVSIIDIRTGLPIQLALDDRDANGAYILFQTKIE